MSTAKRCAPGVYRARRPKESPLWRLLKDRFDDFLAVYDTRFASTYGPLRKVIPRAVGKFLKCGILDYGFARIRCPECGDECLLAHSCKSRCLCPSCQKKRQVQFGEFLATELLEPVAHRHVVLSVPRRLRPFFRRDRRRLPKLARVAYETVKELLQTAAGMEDTVPGAVACVQSYGNYLDWHPHIHMLISWGLFRRDGQFVGVEEVPEEETVEKLFRQKVLRLLLDEGAIDEKIVASLLAWKHTGFGAHVGKEIPGADARARENVARYLCHPPVVLARILAEPGAEKVIYTGDTVHPRHAANFRVFDPLEFIAQVVSHIPDAYEKVAIAYGWYSNKTRGSRRARGLLAPAPVVPAAAEGEQAPLEVRRNWARLIAKVYEVDPLRCTHCGAEMKIVAVIDQAEVISKILGHLGLLSPPEESRAPPKAVWGARGGVGAQGEASFSQADFFADPVYEDLGWEDAGSTGTDEAGPAEGPCGSDPADAE